MPYRYKHGESVEHGTQRIAREQLRRAIDELNDPELDPAEAVHQARKRLKKLRGLLRLVRPVLGRAAYKRYNKQFRDLGRALAGARDAEVMLQTLADLREGLLAQGEEVDLSGLQRELEARKERITSSDIGKGLETRRTEVGAELQDTRDEVVSWGLAEKEFEALGPGLQEYYRRGRKALANARSKPGDTHFHEWRKRVKDHWYHSRLLRDTWTELMKTYATEMKRLSDLLGDDHDLAVFRQTLEEMGDEILPSASRKPLYRHIKQREESLRDEAVRLGLRVYAEKPKRFRKRIGACWQVWRQA
jgi:CHAD domain-containing protein